MTRTASGEHPAVVALRDKLDSIAEHTIPATTALLSRVEKLKAKSDRPPAEDERREDADEEQIHDVVRLHPKE